MQYKQGVVEAACEWMEYLLAIPDTRYGARYRANEYRRANGSRVWSLIKLMWDTFDILLTEIVCNVHRMIFDSVGVLKQVNALTDEATEKNAIHLWMLTNGQIQQSERFISFELIPHEKDLSHTRYHLYSW